MIIIIKKEWFLVIDKIENLTEYLVKHNIKPSFQRIKILESLIKYNDHPTADEVYNKVLEEIPTL